MHPYLFDWVIAGHHFRPPTYGILLALAFSAAYFESLRRAIKLGEDPKHIENLFLFIVLSSVLGSRLFHVLFEDLSYYLSHPSKILAVWEGGYTLYGAILASTLAIVLYTRYKKINFLAFADIAAASAALGVAIGRVGCFAAGCCWGRPTTLPWGVVFSNPDTFSEIRNTPLHPTQLYESFGALVLFLYLLWRFERRRYIGQIFFHAIGFYALLRFAVEYFRGDDYRGYLFGGVISYSQFVSLVILPFALAGAIVYSRRPENQLGEAPKGKSSRKPSSRK